MKKLILIMALATAACNTSKTEVGCNCNEVKDKRFVTHEYPYLYWQYLLYVDYCDSGLQWVTVQESKYNSTNRGDCY